jgi:hypothetical protein
MEGKRREGRRKTKLKPTESGGDIEAKKQQKISSENFAILLGMNLRRKYSFALWYRERERKHTITTKTKAIAA